MTSTTEFIAARPARAGGRLLRLVEAGAARVAAWWRAAGNRRSVVTLLDWDERMLRDIGLTPNDVRSALAMPLSRDPTSHLGDLSHERRMALRATVRERLVRRRFTGLDS